MSTRRTVTGRTALWPLSLVLGVAVSWGAIGLFRAQTPLWEIAVNPVMTTACLLMLGELHRRRGRHDRPGFATQRPLVEQTQKDTAVSVALTTKESRS